MSAETMATHEPRKLGLVGKAIVGLMVVATVIFSVVSVLALRAKRIEDERRVRDEQRAAIRREIEALRGSLAAIGSSTAETLRSTGALDRASRRHWQPEGQAARLVQLKSSLEKDLVDLDREDAGGNATTRRREEPRLTCEPRGSNSSEK